MKLTLSMLALTASITATPIQLTNNYCPYPKYLWLSLNATSDVPASDTLPSSQAWIYNITGEGNQMTVANQSVPFGTPTPRLQLGTSFADDIVYW
jgi:hypothetical protein